MLDFLYGLITITVVYFGVRYLSSKSERLQRAGKKSFVAQLSFIIFLWLSLVGGLVFGLDRIGYLVINLAAAVVLALQLWRNRSKNESK